MRRAIELAQHGIGDANPNPLVGAVVVKEGNVLGEAFHAGFGGPHAEAGALKIAGEAAEGADLYVNWEPCVAYPGKRTAPCADAIISSGIKRVILGAVDPTPDVNGKGIEQLRAAGIEVVEGVLETECARLNEIRAKFATTGKPFVLLKMAMTADGKIATRSKDSKWISSEESLKLAHWLRVRYAAVLVGIGTVHADDPQLTARHLEGRDPVRVVLDSRGEINPDAKILHLESAAPTIIATTSMSTDKERKLLKSSSNVEVWRFAETPTGHVNLDQLLAKLGASEIDSLFVEGGAGVAASFLEANLLDKIRFVVAPKLIGGTEALSPIGGHGIEKMAEAVSLRNFSCEMLGDDIVIEGYPDYSKRGNA